MQSARSVQPSRSVELRQSSSVETCFPRQQVRTLTVCRVHVSSLVTQDSSNVSDQFLPSFHMINSEFLYLTCHLTICCSTNAAAVVCCRRRVRSPQSCRTTNESGVEYHARVRGDQVKTDVMYEPIVCKSQPHIRLKHPLDPALAVYLSVVRTYVSIA